MPRSHLFSITTLALLCAAPVADAENWPQWRGPGQDGVSSGIKYPTEWDENRNIAWKVQIPGWGTSTPAIWDDRIFVTGASDGKNALVCLSRESGETRWMAQIGEAAGNRNRKASGSNPSPVLDGENVYVYFRSGDLASLSFEGELRWSVNLQEKYGADGLNWDLGTSPLLVGDRIVVAVQHQAPSYLVAFDKRTGAESWKVTRATGAPGESRDSYTTPLLVEENGHPTIVVLGADALTGHSPETGEERWRFANLNPERRVNYRSIASPVISGDLIVAPYSRGATLTAVHLGGQGDISESHLAWMKHDAAGDVPTPAVQAGRVYVCQDRGDVVCIDAQSGELIWTERLPRNRFPYSASPVIAGGNLYVTREDGTTFVLAIGAQPRQIATNSLFENTYATPVFLDGRIYLRTSDYLFCIAEP